MYDSLSDQYHWFVNWPNRLRYEMPFLEKTLQSVERGRPRADVRILDTACGTGMHALALAKLGYQVSGADLSAGMVKHARENAAAEGFDIPFAQAGFGDLLQVYPPARFDAVFCLGNSLPHLTTLSEVAETFQQFAALLAPGGVLLIQNRNFDAVMAARQRWMEPQGQRNGTQEWIFVRFYDFQADGLINFNVLTLQREDSGPWKQTQGSTLLRPQLHTELVELAQQAGLQSVQCFGGMDGSAFNAQQSGDTVLLAHRGDEK